MANSRPISSSVCMKDVCSTGEFQTTVHFINEQLSKTLWMLNLSDGSQWETDEAIVAEVTWVRYFTSNSWSEWCSKDSDAAWPNIYSHCKKYCPTANSSWAKRPLYRKNTVHRFNISGAPPLLGKTLNAPWNCSADPGWIKVTANSYLSVNLCRENVNTLLTYYVILKVLIIPFPFYNPTKLKLSFVQGGIFILP